MRSITEVTNHGGPSLEDSSLSEMTCHNTLILCELLRKWAPAEGLEHRWVFRSQVSSGASSTGLSQLAACCMTLNEFPSF